jgi:hypothetical protein
MHSMQIVQSLSQRKFKVDSHNALALVPWHGEDVLLNGWVQFLIVSHEFGKLRELSSIGDQLLVITEYLVSAKEALFIVKLPYL